MTDKIVELNAGGKENRASQEVANKMREARIFARMAGLDLMSYDRERLDAARELGCRPATLDRIVDAARGAVADLVGQWPKSSDPWAIGEEVCFNDGDRIIPSICLASREREGGAVGLVLLADGNGTVCRIVPAVNPVEGPT